jgi:hypothetical protein
MAGMATLHGPNGSSLPGRLLQTKSGKCTLAHKSLLCS